MLVRAGGHAVERAVDHELVADGPVHLVPGQPEARGREVAVLLRGGLEHGRLEGGVLDVGVEDAVVLEAAQLEGLPVGLDVGLGELHVQLWCGGDLLAGELLRLHGIGRRGGCAVVEVGALVVEHHGLALGRHGGVKRGLGVDLPLLKLLVAVLCHDGCGPFGHVRDERGGAVLLVARVPALGLLGGEHGLAGGVDLGGVRGGHVAAVAHLVLGAVFLVV